MKKITVPVKDIVTGDVIALNNVRHKVYANVNHPSGRVILGGYEGNTYVIAVFQPFDVAFMSMEVYRR